MADLAAEYCTVIHCPYCDFSSGRRGMDRCSKCDGAGSQLVLKATGERWPNTPEGLTGLEARRAEIVTGADNG